MKGVKVRMQEDEADAPVKVTIKSGKKPAEVFRTDLITAMKIPDHQTVTPGTYFDLSDPWKQEWEKGVQVPVNKESLPQPSFKIANSGKPLHTEFRMPYKLVKCAKKKANVPQKVPLYDLDDEDVEWLNALNKSRKNRGLEMVDELLVEKAVACLEDQCYTNMGETISTAKGLSIEYDEDIACDVCRSPECEDGNEILFCDVCDVAVHQACYGVQKVPIGSWVCKPCTQLLSDCPCLLCSTRGGAMKQTKSKGIKGWVHMSCALWIPEVGIGNVERMEPITKIETITPGRWNLLCYLCKEKQGACIQCSVKSCVTAFHVTCGFDNNLHMQTVWDDSAPDGVRHVCYCSKHTEKRSVRSPRKPSPLKSPQNPSPCTTPSKSSSGSRAKEQEERENLRQNRLRGMEEEFYKYADAEDLASELNITAELATTFHRFWTLKRKTREDAALLPPTAEQQERLSGRQIKPFQKATMEVERVVRLRQDLERIRNLCYMVEKREKHKRELTAAREAVFRKELEVVDDTSNRMSTEDVRWARSCCAKNFTEYEELQTLDLRYPAKAKIYTKRGRKPKRTTLNRINGFVLASVMTQSDGIMSEHSGECEEVDSGNHHEDSSFYSSHFTPANDHSVDQETTSHADVPSTSSGDITSSVTDGNTPTLRRNTTTRSANSNNDDMSSDSDFENELAQKAKRRASISRLRMRKLSKSDTEVLEGTRSGDAVCSTVSSPTHSVGSSSVQLNARLNGLKRTGPVNLLEDEQRAKSYAHVSSKTVAGKRNRKRLFCAMSEKHNDSQSPRTLRSSSTTLGGQLTYYANFEKRVCRPNGILLPKSSSSSFNNGEGQSEEIGELEIRLTKSRSHASDADLSSGNGKLEVPFTRSQSRISDTDSSEKSGKLGTPFTRSRSRASDADLAEENGKLDVPLTRSQSRISDRDSSEKNSKLQVPLTRSQSRMSDRDSSEKNGTLEVPFARSQSRISDTDSSEINSKLDVPFTRSRSHASDADSSEENSKVELLFTRSRNRTPDANFLLENGKAEDVRFTRSRSHTAGSDLLNLPLKQNTVFNTVGKQSEKEENIQEFCKTRSHSSRAISTANPSTINGVSCIKKSEDSTITNASQQAQHHLSNHQVSDVYSRTRSRRSTSDYNSSPVKYDVGISHFLDTAKNTKTNCKTGSANKEATAEGCKRHRRQARLSDNLGTSKATLCSPNKCSKFFGKPRHAATTSA